MIPANQQTASIPLEQLLIAFAHHKDEVEIAEIALVCLSKRQLIAPDAGQYDIAAQQRLELGAMHSVDFEEAACPEENNVRLECLDLPFQNAKKRICFQ